MPDYRIALALLVLSPPALGNELASGFADPDPTASIGQVCPVDFVCSSKNGPPVRVYPLSVTPSAIQGLEAWTLAVETSGDTKLRSIDAIFTGSLNQVTPFGLLPTIFQDNNHIFSSGGPSPNTDSQFLFSSRDILATTAEESPRHLRATISGLNQLDLDSPTPFVSIVTENPFGIRFDLTIGASTGEAFPFSGSLSDFFLIPEPTSAGLLALSAVAAFRRGARS